MVDYNKALEIFQVLLSGVYYQVLLSGVIVDLRSSQMDENQTDYDLIVSHLKGSYIS